ncbi:Smr/MutS family protein [Falsiroseomonas stagni]|uniref:DNA-nicking endonuclease, Smr domain n=1 Tax=Falsiroseomonas stagni DSM 19981 TaxID=1123062 RepID=A0A1I4A5Y3_9PROT|nr:Smr/MutS family protein [Falsiroseomonas stagni]SFK51341.1 DNA-nicking endonuclease, Smr domain [Falsiroseomonas stagni DSM 19981]
MIRRARPKGLSGTDLALWHAYTAEITPLFGRARPAAPEAPPAPPPVPPAEPILVKPAPKPAGRPAIPEIRVGEAPGGLDRKRWTALRRGDMRAERTLDLHGRRVQEAHAALRAFIHDAAADGIRTVTVVTGKGPQPEGGILKRELPHWLNAPDLRPLVLGAAHPHPTNAGAVNLLLRRVHRAKGW